MSYFRKLIIHYRIQKHHLFDLIGCLKVPFRWIRIFYHKNLLSNKWKNYYLAKDVILSTLESKSKYSSFFGYYGNTPQNNLNEFLYCETDCKKKRGNISSNIKIYKFNHSNSKIFLIDKTSAWNWQQGCMLQWIYNSNSKIIFNTYNKDKDEYGSKLIDLSNGDIKLLSKPIYSVSRDGIYALTLNFQRLAKLRPDYGYFCKKKNSELSRDSDGIWILNLQNNTSKLILTLNQIIDFEFDSSMKYAVHKVNHIQISPDGNRFMFFHIWKDSNRRFTRLITSDMNGGNLVYITGNYFVSHCCWKSNDEIIAYCEDPNDKIKKYMLLKDLSKYNSSVDEIHLLSEDGHPSVSPDGKWLLTDTYPSRKTRISSLFIYNFNKRKQIKLGEFYNPLKFKGEIRCDLHPRWCVDQNYISIDSVFSGKRKQYILDIRQILKENN